MLMSKRATVFEAFWPLWILAVALQVLDVASVALAGAGRRIREVNPVLLALEAHYGVFGAALLKAGAVGAGLALVAGFYLLAGHLRSRLLGALCLASMAAVAVYSAVVLWNNVAALAGH